MTKISVGTRVAKAKVDLLEVQPFYGMLSMHLTYEEDYSVETLCTNGTYIKYSPMFLETLTDAELVGCIAHEVEHCAMQHMYRREGRDPEIWNQACDYHINPKLIAAGLRLPKGVLNDPKYNGMCSETIYERLVRANSGKPGKPSPTGEFVDAPSKGEGKPSKDAESGTGQKPGPGEEKEVSPLTATDWQILAEQAAMTASKAGKFPGDMGFRLKEARGSQTNWREILHRFVEQVLPQDYSWTNPNRRYISAGVYLPGMVKENTPRIGIGFDTSGSIAGDPELMNTIGQEITSMLHEVRPESIDVYYCDTKVSSVQRISPEDAEVKLEPTGGGGTLFQPVFDWIEQHEDENKPACLIYFTDLYGPAPRDPGYPVLWCVPEFSTEREGPFGETVRISSHH